MMAGTDKLEGLVLRTVEGDRDAFEALFEATSERVFRYVRARLSEREDALDALQEIYVDLWRALSGFRFLSDESFYAFLFLIARRRLGKHYRAEARQKAYEEGLSPVAEPVYYEDNYRDLEETVRTLPQGLRDVIELRYFAGLPFEEIAKALRISLSAARVRHHRAIAHLRTFLGDI